VPSKTVPRRRVFAVLCAVQFLLVLDIAVTSVALPAIKSDLGLALADLQWVGAAYLLAFGGLLIPAGRAADLFGRRRLLLVGLTVFIVSSLLCGLAQEGWQLFAARALQGLGAAIVAPAALSVGLSVFPDERERNQALGIWGAVAAVGSVAGQLVGGVLTESMSWRWVFFINLPLGAMAVLAVLLVLQDSRRPYREPLDLVGGITLTAGLATGVLGISRLATGGGLAVGAAVVAVAAVLLAAFVAVERRQSHPLVRFGILADRERAAGMGLLALLAAISATVIFFSTLYLQEVLGYSPLAVAVAFVPVIVLIVTVSTLVGRLLERYGARTLLLAGAVANMASLALLVAGATPGGGYATDVLPGFLLHGLGMGVSFAAAMNAALARVDDHDHALASGVLTTVQHLGGALGVSMLAAVVAGLAPSGGAAGSAYRVGYLTTLVLPAAAFVLATFLPRRSRHVTAAHAVPAQVAGRRLDI
jgi:EmrB/QacA subfamily drug resistance transporter